MKKDKQYIRNIVSELILREYGLSDRTEMQIRDRGRFHQNCLGSLYTVQSMQFSHFVKESSMANTCINFKNDRNLVCAGNSNKRIYVHDWKDYKFKYSFKTKHPKTIYDVKFLNTGGNGMDIISTCLGGQVRHTCIAPAGNFASKRIFLNTSQRHRLITVPRSPLEFIAASTNGGLFLIDLRSERWSPSPDQILSSEKGWFWIIEDIAHHPFAPEICVCGKDAFVKIFDKRNLKNVLKKMCPNHLMNSAAVVNHCSYNYDGSEILANYYGETAYLFDNKNYNAGEFLHSYTKCANDVPNYLLKFFGPKSEYIVHCSHERNIFFQDKNTEAFIKTGVERSDLENSTNSFGMMLETHPYLPVIVSTALNDHISIWAPSKFKSNSTDDVMVL